MNEHVFPRVTKINAKPAKWSDEIKSLWAERVAPLFQPGDSCSSANYHTPRPYKDEWNRGSDEAGFVYVVQPGDHVCFAKWQDLTPPERDEMDKVRDVLLATMLRTGRVRYVAHTVIHGKVQRVSFLDADDVLIFALVVMGPEKDPRLAKHRRNGPDSEVVDGKLTREAVELAIRRWVRRNHLGQEATSALVLELSDG